MYRWLMVAATAVALVSCATPNQQFGVLGGLDAKELRPDVYRISFNGNGFTTRESVQVYWLNRCAELALEKGYAGFEILSDMQFVMRAPSMDDRGGFAVNRSVASLKTRIPVSSKEAADFSAWRSPDQPVFAEPIRLAAGTVIFYGGGVSIPKPSLEGDVHFLAAPVESAPPKIFNAKALLGQLAPIINGEKCGGNVCPHVHEYLLPKGKLR